MPGCEYEFSAFAGPPHPALRSIDQRRSSEIQALRKFRPPGRRQLRLLDQTVVRIPRLAERESMPELLSDRTHARVIVRAVHRGRFAKLHPDSVPAAADRNVDRLS